MRDSCETCCSGSLHSEAPQSAWQEVALGERALAVEKDGRLVVAAVGDLVLQLAPEVAHVMAVAVAAIQTVMAVAGVPQPAAAAVAVAMVVVVAAVAMQTQRART